MPQARVDEVSRRTGVRAMILDARNEQLAQWYGGMTSYASRANSVCSRASRPSARSNYSEGCSTVRETVPVLNALYVHAGRQHILGRRDASGSGLLRTAFQIE